jgi:protein O-mannosyl-transferase
MLKSFKLTPIVLFCFVVFLTFLAYSRSLHAPFVLDDHMYLDPSRLKSISQYLTLSRRSVSYLSFALNYHFSGMNVVAFRLTNIICHIVSAGLVFYLTYITLNLPAVRDKYGKPGDKKTSLFIALFTATLFSLHPIQTSAVTYITQRMTVMAAMFSFAGIILYVRGAITAGKEYIYYYSFSVLFIMLAIFSKENAVMVLPVLMLYDFMFISSFRWSEFRKRFIPLAVLGIIMGCAVAYYLHADVISNEIISLFSNPNTPMGTYKWSGVDINWTPVEYILTELRVVSRYIFLILVPLPSYMVFDYSNAYPVSKSLFHPVTTVFSLVSLVTMLFFPLRFFKKFPLISFGILWYLITISLESFIAIGLDPYFEHRNYLPSYGLFLVLASLFVYTDRSPVKVRKELIILIAALLLSVLTFTRNGVWREESLLWEDVVAKSPHNARAHLHLGRVYKVHGVFDKAIEHYQTAIRLNPYDALAYNNLGSVYLSQGLTDKAIEQYQNAIRLKPDFPVPYNNLGNIYNSQGLPDRAIEQYRIAINLKPDFAEAHNNLGNVYASQKLTGKAIEHYQTAIRLKPDYAEAHNNMGIAYNSQGLRDKAIEQYQIAIDLKPDYAEAHNNLENAYKSQGRSDRAVEGHQLTVNQNHQNAEAYYRSGNVFFKEQRMDQAIEHYQLAVKLKPDFISAHYNLGVAFMSKGSMDKAIEQYQLVIKLNPDYAEAHENMGIIYANKGLIDKAIKHFKIATALNPQNQAFRDNLAKAYQMRNPH